MNNFTLLETILIIYILVVNVLGVVGIITVRYASRKVGETIFIIWVGFAMPIALPITLYLLIFDKLKRKRKQDLEKQFDDFVKENDKWE